MKYGHHVVPSSIGMNLLGLAYNHGGAWETVGTRGISHLMEHLMCKTSDDLREELRGLGIEHNAYTSDNQVVFWFSGLNDCLLEMSQTLYDRITKQTILWDKESFENEKKTVLQEYADTFNGQFEGFYYNLMRKHYKYGGAIGYRTDIVDFTYEDSIEYAKKFITPRLVCEVGESYVSNASTGNHRVLPSSLTIFGSYDEELEHTPKEDKTSVAVIGTKPFSYTESNIANFIISILTGGLEAPLYQEIREKRGLSYFSSGWTTQIGDKVVPFFGAVTTNDNVEELVKIYTEFFSTDMRQHITESRFEACLKNMKVKKRTAEILPHAGSKATVLGDQDPFDGMENYTYEEVIKTANTLFNLTTLKVVTDRDECYV